jgi:hypothetical protein
MIGVPDMAEIDILQDLPASNPNKPASTDAEINPVFARIDQRLESMKKTIDRISKDVEILLARARD